MSTGAGGTEGQVDVPALASRTNPPQKVDAGGPQLNNLAGLVFGRAAGLWYRGLAIEVIASIIGAVLAITAPAGTIASVGSVVIVTLFVIAYVTRLLADETSDIAQTMRRQAAFSEGLGWPIKQIQLEDWRLKAGNRLLKQAKATPRDSDYYASTEPIGARRMAEMTRESAFYTRHMRLVLRDILIFGLAALIAVLGVIAYLVLANVQAADTIGPALAQAVGAVILLVIALDAFGWIRRLNRQATSIRDVEEGLDTLLENPTPSRTDVLRLVAEYDCALVGDIPVHQMIWNWRHDGIRELWEHRVDQAQT